MITRWPRIHPDDVNKFIKKCKSIQYTSLDDNVLDSVMDCELSALIETDSGIFYTALKNPDYWREYYAAHSVSETDDDTVKWIRVHDFCVVIQVIKQFVQHRIVKALKLCYSGVLQSFWDNF
ncbi:unnamed protein product [Trichobilharzia regenti]|nr:unnamed protein product [Trichobilharzia regenti]